MEGVACTVLYAPRGSQNRSVPASYCRTVSNMDLAIKNTQQGILGPLKANVYIGERGGLLQLMLIFHFSCPPFWISQR